MAVKHWLLYTVVKGLETAHIVTECHIAILTTNKRSKKPTVVYKHNYLYGKGFLISQALSGSKLLAFYGGWKIHSHP